MSRSALVLSTVGLTAAALVTSTVVATAATAATPVGRSSVHFHTTKSQQVQAPRSTRPGIAHLRAQGRTVVAVVEAKHGTGSARAAAAGLNSNTPDKLLAHYRFVGLITPGAGVYTRLTRGTYYVANIFGEKIRASRIATMTVTGSPVNAKLPRSKDVTVSRSKQLHVPHSLPRTGWLDLRNRSSAFTNILVVGVATSATYKALRDLVAHPTLKKLGSVLDMRLGGTLAISDAAGHSETWMHFAARHSGRYVAAVFPIRSRSTRLHQGQVRILHVK